ncbi:UDP-glucose 4-epimerase [hydrothermal vent metagenome]|uniref:UDP-glucose 4-epimerase n=1 Tax=hydrothermal vent metagenome TaxID=652676 RepID=A0A3B0TJ98_9ZZZZ
MSVLVTGGAGYIGSHMVLALLDRGEEVVVLDNLSTGHKWAVPEAAGLVVGEAGDEKLVGRLIKRHDIDAIAHFAGSIVVPDSVTDPLSYYLNNTVTSRAVMAAAVAGGVRNFIFSSTAAVYGAARTNPIGEDAPLLPISPYGTSKMMTEFMLRDAALAYDFRYTALRYFNVAGADPKGRSGQSTPRATHLIKMAAQTALGDRPQLDIFGTDYDTPDGTCIRDYIHVTDLASAHLQALDRLRGGGGSVVLNCGYGCGFSVREVIGAVERAAKTVIPVREAPRRAGDPPALVAGVAAILKTLDWVPAHDDLDEIAASALAWERHLRGRPQAA